MYAHLTKLRLRPDTMDDVMHIYEQHIIPLVQQQEGCRLITLLTDPSSHQFIAIGWWENEAALQAGQKDYLYQQHLAQISPMLVASPVCTSYQVSMQVAPI